MARRRRGQFPLPKEENGQWKVRFYTDQAQPDGTIKRVRKTKCLGRVEAMTFREARKETQRFLEAINDVEPWIEQSERTMNELIEQWREAIKPNLKRSTRSQYDDWAIRKWIQPRFGRWPLSEISKAEVQSFLTAAARKLAGKSVRDLRIVLRSLFSIAVDWEWIEKNPAGGRFRMPEARPVRPKVILEPVQFQALLRQLPQPYKTAAALAVLAGMRKGEIGALRWRDVSAGEIVVDEAVYRGELGSPKTASSKRRVAVGRLVDAMLAEWRSRARFTGPADFVFGLKTNTPIDLHNVAARQIKPLCRELGLPAVGWHDLRHTYTTWGRRAGVGPEAMRDQLGHSSVEITLDVYSHLDDRAGAAERIERFATNEAA